MTIKKVYTYLILFATLMMTIGGSVAAFMALADILNPPPFYQSYEQFKEMKQMKPVEKGDSTPAPELSEAQQRENYDRMVAQEKSNTRQRAINSLIKSLGWIVIPFPIFMYYQRKVGRDAKE